jgi:hypothetical protein
MPGKLCSRGAVLRADCRIGPAFEKCPHGGGATRSNGAMERSGPVHVSSVGICARVNEAHDRRCLRNRIPPWRDGIPDSRRMKRFTPPAVPRSDVSSGLDEFANERVAIRGRGKMQRRIVRVNVVADFCEEMRTGAASLACCSVRKRRGGQRRGLGQRSRKESSVVGDNRVHQRSQGLFRSLLQFLSAHGRSKVYCRRWGAVSSRTLDDRR